MKLRHFFAGIVALATVAVLGEAYSLGALGGSAFPLTYISTSPVNLVDGFNQLLGIINQQTVGISTTYSGTMGEPAAGVDTSSTAFSTTPQGNPLSLNTHYAMPLASVNEGTNILASQANRVIYPSAGLSVMVSGTASGATSVSLECEPSATIIATWPIGTLINLTPVGIYASASSGVEPTVVLGSALTNGCPIQNSVMLSANGTLATTSVMYVNMPYTVQ